MSPHAPYRIPEDVLTIAVSDEPPLAKQNLPALHRNIVAPSLAGATHVDVVLTLPPAGPDGKSEFHVNSVPFWKATPFLAKVGETQNRTVKNETKWAHPMHLHGFSLFHCHILDHANGGLMGHVHLRPDSSE